MTTLENSYCVPKTQEEKDLLTKVCGKKIRRWRGGVKSNCFALKSAFLTADGYVSVKEFVDMFEDSISPWRLKEAGFSEVYNLSGIYRVMICPDTMRQLHVFIDGKQICVSMDIDLDGIVFNVSTFTDLLTLIRFLSPE